MEKPTSKPHYPYFSSGPCAKPPGWSLDKLKDAALSRSHRSGAAVKKLQEVINKSREILQIPDDYLIGIVPASDTGAVEMAMWCMLGQRGVEVYSWENFGHDWNIDAGEQLPLDNKILVKADYGDIPDFSKSNPDNDIVFTWNGTTAGVRIKNTDWISDDRKGLTICDATSAVFSMEMDWPKLDVVTYSWQKVLGSEAAHGMLILSPRAVERLESYTPPWPVPKVFRLAQNQKLISGIFSGATINTPSMISVEDVLNSLNWSNEVGGISKLIEISENNLKIVSDWIETSENFEFLAKDPETRSCTSICIIPKDEWFKSLSSDDQKKFMAEVCSQLETNEAGYDLNSYKTAPPGIRIWGGSTVENKNVELVLPWIDWAYSSTKSNFQK
ncbi:phosphoserine transaminase [Pelagibacteraceae bacterium]|jgi:phosphoserine aminotransferase|nr:phosphoserine transaminase [Pelagibacteraceae bacterium]MDC3208568.1 phosphoserine transaminase [Pelagibacteraceae bacterium]|tara:strand:+ start:437 stop:1597 length:1161 start_codon:yes stop_codon:yes gene_type:complete